MLGGPIIAGATLSRFFAMHVFVIPGLLIAFVSLHVLLVLKVGINEWPMPGRIVRRTTYVRQYHELVEKFENDGEELLCRQRFTRKDIMFSRRHPSRDWRLCSPFRTFWTRRSTGPDNHSDDSTS